MRPVCFICCLLILCAGQPLLAAKVNGKDAVDFVRHIRPILSDKCFACHGPDAKKRKAELRLDVKRGVFGEGESGETAVARGKPAESELVRRITSADADERMPPSDSGKSLTVDEILLLQEWIRAGAPWKDHWSFVPPTRPPPPGVQKESWVRNEIDRFVLAQLETENLTSSAEADRRTLVRRLYLDLIGLPPARGDVHAFLDDKSTNAYENLVDRLLASEHFGERMALAWMDQARYADTNGYSIDGGRHMWMWRDWVIAAYNRNMPFDQFAVEQLAGDLLPGATEQQRVATGFNRNHINTHEGGTIPEENLVNYRVDRVRTTAEVFLGLTMGCAQCHDHKYDPISQRDFYQFFAYFDTLSDRGLDGDGGRNSVPNIRVKSVLADEGKSAAIRAEIAQLEAELAKPHPRQATWEERTRQQRARRGCNFQLRPVKVLKVSTPNTVGVFQVEKDSTVRMLPGAASHFPQVSMKVDAPQIDGVRIVFPTDPEMHEGRTGYGQRLLKGSFVMSGFSISGTSLPADQTDLYKVLSIRWITASASHPDYPPQNCLDERAHNGWSPYPADTTPQHITFTFHEPLDTSKRPYLAATLTFMGGGHGWETRLFPSRFRIYGFTGIDDGTNVPDDVHEILDVPTDSRTSEQADRIRAYHAEVGDVLAPLRHRLASLRERLDFMTQPHEVMVMDTGAKRKTFILNRGQYDQPTEAVEPGVPAALPPLPADAPSNRLGLAHWLVGMDHPLTARVAVNRLWQVLFGTGIVSTSGDFGSQGQPPSHPELLDWMAVDFVENGWNVKRTIKQIVMSATYRQSSRVTPEQMIRDPQNRLLARGPRFRMQAELIRDNALAVSNLLNNWVGGPSVRPYQPRNLWKEVSHFGSTPATAQVFVQDHGPKLYRRSLYTYWKRTVPPPSMVTFDAPSRELCTMKRVTTNTPLQALVLLNDPQFVEAARAFAQRIMLEGPDDVDGRIHFAFEAATGRLPNAKETAILKRTYDRELASWRTRREVAGRLLAVGESPRDRWLEPAEHAAWTQVATLILNLSETITKG